jgi:hypothetical protein
MYQIPTADGKFIQVEKAFIEVSANDRIDCGYFFDLKVKGILPRGRKSQTLSYTPSTGKIHFMSLFNTRGWHGVEPEALRTFLKTLKVVPYRNDSKLKAVPPELETEARKYIEAICDCPAVTKFDKNTGWYTK